MKGNVRVNPFFRDGSAWSVHSVYRHTINIVRDEMLLAVHPDRIPLTPLSLSVPLNEQEFDRFAEEAVCGEKVFLCRKEDVDGDSCRIYMADREWDMGVWESWNPQIVLHLPLESLRVLGNETAGFLRQQGIRKGGLQDAAVMGNARRSDNMLTAALRERVQMVVQNGLSDLEGLKRAVAAMIGLGVGLTPSGDDFLVGLLLALSVGLPGRMEPVLEELKAHIRRFSGGTNDISRQYLLCACRREYGLRLHELLQAGAEGKGIRTALEKTAEIGHSSGVDTLNGLLAGIKIIQEALNEKTGEKEGTVW